MAKNPYIGKITHTGTQIVKVAPAEKKGAGKVRSGGRDGK